MKLFDNENNLISENIVTNPEMVDEYGSPVKGGLLDPEIFGETRNSDYTDSSHDFAKGVEILDRYGDKKTDMFGRIPLNIPVIDPQQYSKIKTFVTPDLMEDITYYNKGIWVDPKTGAEHIGSLYELEDAGTEDFSQIMSGGYGIAYLLSKYDDAPYDYLGSRLLVVPASYRRCMLIQDKEEIELFEYNNVNECYRQIIQANNNIERIKKSPIHPTEVLWNAYKKLQHAVDELSTELNRIEYR